MMMNATDIQPAFPKMFWNLSFQLSQIDTLLDNENVNLTRLLDEEDILQECKGQNQKLIKYLSQPAVIEELLDLALNAKLDESKDERLQYKYPSLASELLTADTETIPSILVGDTLLTPAASPPVENGNLPEEASAESPAEGSSEPNRHHYLDVLFNFLHKAPPLNPLVCSFFMKIFDSLLSRKSKQILAYVTSKNDFVSLLLHHFDVSAMMDVLLAFFEKVSCFDAKREVHQYFHNNALIPQLLQLLQPEQTDDTVRCTGYCLTELVTSLRSSVAHFENENKSSADQEFTCLLDTLESEATVSQVLSNITSPNTNKTLVDVGCTFLQTLIDSTKVSSPLELEVENLVKISSERTLATHTNIVNGILPHCKALFDFLRNPPQSNSDNAKPPFGALRLAILQLIECLVGLNNSNFNEMLIHEDMVTLIMGFVKDYPWNSFLHKSAEVIIRRVLAPSTSNKSSCSVQTTLNHSTQSTGDDILLPASEEDAATNDMEVSSTEPADVCSTSTILNSTNATTLGGDEEDSVSTSTHSALMRHLLVTNNYLSCLLNLVQENSIAINGKQPRRGYMGHVIRIANEIETLATDNSLHIKAIWEDIPEATRHEWTVFVQNDLKKCNEQMAGKPANIGSSGNSFVEDFPYFEDNWDPEVQESASKIFENMWAAPQLFETETPMSKEEDVWDEKELSPMDFMGVGGGGGFAIHPTACKPSDPDFPMDDDDEEEEEDDDDDWNEAPRIIKQKPNPSADIGSKYLVLSDAKENRMDIEQKDVWKTNSAADFDPFQCNSTANETEWGDFSSSNFINDPGEVLPATDWSDFSRMNTADVEPLMEELGENCSASPPAPPTTESVTTLTDDSAVDHIHRNEAKQEEEATPAE